MRVTIFGANGSTGRETVSACRARGHHVVAAVRRPDTMQDIDGIDIAEIDLNKPDTLDAALEGADALVSCLGHGSLRASAKYTDLYSRSTSTYLDAMQRTGCRRIVTLSSGGTEEDPAAPGFYRNLIRPYLINTYVDMARMEERLAASDTDWTAVRLTYLLEGDSKPYRVEDGRIGRGSFKIHFVDAGKFIAQELDTREWIGRCPVLGYPD